MKIYDFAGAPNPKRVRMYLREKEIEDIELVHVNIVTGENRSDAFKEKNPQARLPVLELDDGRCFSESVAIIEYLEELYPDPAMIGTTAEERLAVRRADRICELGVLFGVARMVQNSHAFFARSVKQSPEGVEAGSRLAHASLKIVNGLIHENEFVCGDKVTVADCTLYSALWFGHVMNVSLDLSKFDNVQRWNAAMRQRPSAKA